MSEHKRKYKHYAEVVERLLRENPKYRDSDTMLLNRVHNDEIVAKGFDPHKLSVYTYWQWLVRGVLSSESTIERVRRKLQQTYPELRGSKYFERQGKQLDVVKDLQRI